MEWLDTTINEIIDEYLKLDDYIPAPALLMKIDSIIATRADEYNQILAEQVNNAMLDTYTMTDEILEIQQRMYITDNIISPKSKPLYNIHRKPLANKAQYSNPLKYITDTLQLFINPQTKPTTTNFINRLRNTFRNSRLSFTREPNEDILHYLEEKVFKASQKTLNRVGDNIYDIIYRHAETLGQREYETADALRELFDGFKEYEARRIARTEINSAQEHATFQRLVENETVDYVMWVCMNDELVRDSHAEQDGMIVRCGDVFPNGCMFPGDEGGEPEEVINCRCDIQAWFMPVGFTAPDEEYFFEEDIIPVDEVSSNWEQFGFTYY